MYGIHLDGSDNVKAGLLEAETQATGSREQIDDKRT